MSETAATLQPRTSLRLRLRDALPKGQTLPPDAWARRHRWMVLLLWAHIPLLVLLSELQGYPLWHAAGHVLPIAGAGLLAVRTGHSRRLSAAVVSLGLLTASALLVHIEHGLIEMHFHFFVMISILTLYEDWLPFLLAVAYVGLHHGVMGMLDPGGVYNHPGNPWALAGLHAAFVTAAGIANVISWRLNEDVRAELRDAYDDTRLTLDTAQEAYIAIDETGVITGWNREAARLFGWSRKEAIGRTLRDTIIPERYREAHEQGLARFIATREGRLFDKRLDLSAVHRDGREFPIEMTLSANETSEGWRFNAFMHDISHRKASEALLLERASQQAAVADFGRRALEGAPLNELMHDAASLVAETLGVDVAAALELVRDEGILVPRAWAGVDPPAQARAVPAGDGSQAGATLTAGHPIVVEDWETETRFEISPLLRALGVRSGITVVIEGRDGAFGVLGAQSRVPRRFSPEDVSFVQAVANTLATGIERWESEERSRYDALHDVLTGLPNRTLFLDRLRHALARARRARSQTAVLFVDLDHFKVINDSLGHEAGDRLLELVAPRLSEALRVDDTVARFGGDEFIVLCEDVESSERALRLGARITEALAQPFRVGESEIFVTTSVGVALAQPDSSPDSLVRDADAAMYRAKERGPSNVELFDRALRDRVLDRLRLESALRRAVERDELHLVYQPIVALGDGSVSRVEALLRWEHPELGPVSPVEFIPLAEETGLIVALGRWVLEQACREAASWPAAGPAGGRVAVSVNVSPRQLSQPDFPATVAAVLADTGLPASALALEITEGILLEQSDRPLDALAELKQLGVGLILDDFGTGYSSLGYLKRLPIDTVKLDRSFISDLASGKAASSVAIVSAVVRMAHALELSVVGEGVETPEQAGELSKLGCAMAQGYYFARPIGAADLRGLLGRSLPQP